MKKATTNAGTTQGHAGRPKKNSPVSTNVWKKRSVVANGRGTPQGQGFPELNTGMLQGQKRPGDIVHVSSFIDKTQSVRQKKLHMRQHVQQ